MTMTIIYAPPSRGKTLAALAAFPNAAIFSTKRASIIDPATLYGLDIDEDRLCIGSSMQHLKMFARKHKDKPLIIDDLSDLLDSEVAAIKKIFDSTWDVYSELKDRVVPWFSLISKKAEHPVIITAWAKKPHEKKDIRGVEHIENGSPAFPGTSTRDKLPGLCEHVLHIVAQEPPVSSWPFQFQCKATNMWEAKCRMPASVPARVPLALSGLYRAGGYECASMFDEQERVREAAYKALTNPDEAQGRETLGKMFLKLESDGVNLHAAGYAVIEAQVQIALEQHEAGLAAELAGSFF